MNIIVRTDFAVEIGSGHLARCLTICDLLKATAGSITIATTTPPNPLHRKILDAGYKILQVPAGLNEADDAAFCYQWIHSQGASGWSMIVDHYRLGKMWESLFFREYKILAVDDMLREHLCHGLLDSNYRVSYDSLYTSKVPEACSLLLGPKYFPLRQEFIEQKKRQTAPRNHQVMVCFGGTDPTGETLKFLQQVQPEKFTYKVVLPSSHGQFEKIRAMNPPKNVEVIVNPPMAALMAESEIYLGSGGTITWERLYMGLPGLIVTVADNQVENAITLENQKLHSYLGHWNQVSYQHIEQRISDTFTDAKKTQMRKTAEQIVQPLVLSKLAFLLT